MPWPYPFCRGADTLVREEKGGQECPTHGERCIRMELRALCSQESGTNREMTVHGALSTGAERRETAFRRDGRRGAKGEWPGADEEAPRVGWGPRRALPAGRGGNGPSPSLRLGRGHPRPCPSRSKGIPKRKKRNRAASWRRRPWEARGRGIPRGKRVTGKGARLRSGRRLTPRHDFCLRMKGGVWNSS